MSTPTPDHGEFMLRTSLNDDLKMIRQATEKARVNTEKPGHYWQRAVVNAKTPEGTIELVKLYHVDLNANVVEITETVQREERARRTRSLDDMG